MIIFMFVMMVYMHLIDDYVLQGVLAKMKQRKWWLDNAPDKLYKDDYLMALYCHALMWSTSISLPVMSYMIYTNKLKYSLLVIVMISINSIIHMIVDDLKANRHKINLIQDQGIHYLQLLVYFVVVLIVCGG